MYIQQEQADIIIIHCFLLRNVLEHFEKKVIA
jgi:hypothetical protein